MENNHACSAVVVHCIDWRFRNLLTKLLSERFPDGYDLISVAGGVKDKDFVVEQVSISYRLHKPQCIVLIQHEDCGAYGGRQALKDGQAEIECHERELGLIIPILEQKFPEARIASGFIFLDGSLKMFKEFP